MSNLIGKTILHYKIIEKLGEGRLQLNFFRVIFHLTRMNANVSRLKQKLRRHSIILTLPPFMPLKKLMTKFFL